MRACLLPCRRSGSVCRCCRAAVRTSVPCVLPSVGCQCADAPLSDSWQAESVEKSLRKMVVLQPSAALVTRAVAPRQASADANTATVVVDVIVQDRVHLHTCLHHSWKCKNDVEKCKKCTHCVVNGSKLPPTHTVRQRTREVSTHLPVHPPSPRGCGLCDSVLVLPHVL